MNCKNCGNQINTNSNFCPKCGSHINEQNNSSASSNIKKVPIGNCIGISVLISFIVFFGVSILKIVLGNDISEVNTILNLLRIPVPMLILFFGPIVIYIIKQNKLK